MIKLPDKCEVDAGCIIGVFSRSKRTGQVHAWGALADFPNLNLSKGPAPYPQSTPKMVGVRPWNLHANASFSAKSKWWIDSVPGPPVAHHSMLMWLLDGCSERKVWEEQRQDSISAEISGLRAQNPRPQNPWEVEVGSLNNRLACEDPRLHFKSALKLFSRPLRSAEKQPFL
jgi:hypothetical protein